jgi:hypothetical protein
MAPGAEKKITTKEMYDIQGMPISSDVFKLIIVRNFLRGYYFKIMNRPKSPMRMNMILRKVTHPPAKPGA